MKVIHINFGGGKGGAGIAARRISRALSQNGVKSEVWVARKEGLKDDLLCLKSPIFQLLDSAKNSLIQRIASLLKIEPGRSYNLFPSRLIHQINNSDADIIHLHWINAEMISIAQLPKIRKPVVWTLHDMWAFCGAEHYTTDQRFVEGYLRLNNEEVDNLRRKDSQADRYFIDIDRWTFLRKVKHWRKWNPYIITPSHWLKDCAKASHLFRDKPVNAIPNCVNLNTFKPLDRDMCRKKYNLPLQKKIILFGAFNPHDSRKGGDLLEQALLLLKNRDKIAVAVFGKRSGGRLADLETYWLGSFSNETELAEIYNTADLMCVPSRMDNLPNTAVEAIACGIPVVAFDTGGLKDIVDHMKTGYLANAFDSSDLARGIDWILSTLSSSEFAKLSTHAREFAQNTFNYDLVSKKYREIYAIHLEQSIPINHS